MASNVTSKELNEQLSSTKSTYDADWLIGTSAEKLIAQSKRISDKEATNNASKSDFSDPIYQQLSKINGQINSMTMSQLVSSLRKFHLDTEGKREVLTKRLKNYHKEKCLNIPVQPNCQYDYVCVIDFEATCSEAKINFPHEIIEFPIVLVNMKTLEIETHFQAYCKPVLNPKLSGFCKTLTGITQSQVDSAEEFPQVLKQVNEWLEQRELGTRFKFAAATDGPWDMQKFLYMQCEHSQVPFPDWARDWIDVRKLFSNWFGISRCNIFKMLNYIKLEFEGQQHCGLDDSINIARILLRLARDGCKIKTNSKLRVESIQSEATTPTSTESNQVN